MGKEHNNEFWCNGRFIRDMLSRDKEAIEYWEHYLKSHPEKRDAFEQSRRELNKVKLNNYVLAEEKKENLLNKIHEDYARQKRKKQYLYCFVALVAACLLGLLYIVPSFYIRPLSTTENIQAVVLPLTSDSVHTEVTLITENLETVEVRDNSIITCDSNVCVQTSQGLKSISTKKDGKTMTYNTLVVPPGKRSSLLLADGSKVWINAGTVLRFPSSFDSEKRTIEVQGEIYLEVVKDKLRPFYVQTRNFTVHVLGTSFNVSAYPGEEKQSVVLVEGAVTVKTEKEEEFKLTPNQKLAMEQQKYDISQVDVYSYISWKDGILQFKGEPVGEVLKQLSHYYKVAIICNPAIAERSCAGELLLFDDIHQTIETFSMLYDVKYQFESDTIRIE